MNELIRSLEALSQLHQELLQFSKEKTKVIKQGETEQLQQILASERKLVRKLERIENQRIELVDAWGKEHHIGDELTITRVLELIDGKDVRTALERATIELTNAMTDLKAQEKLNHALINQSMQFVQLSLDLFSPSLKNMNYSNLNKPSVDSPNRSIFDSKA